MATVSVIVYLYVNPMLGVGYIPDVEVLVR